MWTKRNSYSNSRRRRKGKRSSLLYTRFRCDPEPWQGSPPKTPPSSDDEAVNNSNYTNTGTHGGRGHSARKILYDCSTDEYAINSNLSISSGLTRSSSETVAPAPILNNNNNNNNHQCRRRLNEVKRKLSQYVKMENANVLQSHQFTQRQTKLNVKKTAPVPLPFDHKNNIKNNKDILINQPLKSKCKLKQKQKSKQKQTAPVPLPPFLANTKSKSKKAKATKQSKESTQPKKAKQIKEIKVEVIDFASIPEAFYIGYDNDIGIDLLYDKNQEIDKSLISNTKQHIIDHGNTNSAKTAHSNHSEEIIMYSPPISATDSSNNYNYNMSDFANSDSTVFTPTLKNKIDHENHMKIEMHSEPETETGTEDTEESEDSYFNDQKFTLLAEKILDENSSFDDKQNDFQYKYIENNNNQRPMCLNQYNQTQNIWAFYQNQYNQTQNIWAETSQYQYQCQYKQQFIPIPQNQAIPLSEYSQSKTLGGLLMHGLPPINNFFFGVS